MDVVIHDFTALAHDGDGHVYQVRAVGRKRPDGTWIGWLEFRPRSGGGLTRRTSRETTQPSRLALRYWALGLDEVYFDGALERAPLESRSQAS